MNILKTQNILLYLLAFFCSVDLGATHNRSGEITFQQLDQWTIEATITTFTKESSINADRDSLEICWGDGNCTFLQRSNGFGQSLSNDVKKNLYIGTHTYIELGIYTLSMTDSHRNAGILNIGGSNPNPINFHIETQLQLLDLATETSNTSPFLLEDPIDIAFTGFPFVHIPNAFDVDGDSIAYELTVPLENLGQAVPNYLSPTEIGTGTNNTLTLDPETGIITWTSPEILGEYNIAVWVKSYRNGIEIDRMIRDLQILVLEGEEPPVSFTTVGFPLEVINEVSVGDTVRVNLDVAESNSFLGLEITSSCGLYDFYDEPATFTSVVNEASGSAEFEWVVRPEHLRTQPYSLVFKVRSDFGVYGPASFALFRFRVLQSVPIAPSPEQLIFQVYPNPVESNILFLRLHENAKTEYQIYDKTGKLLQKDHLRAGEEKIQLKQLPKGVFVLKIEQNGKFGIQTFMIQ